MHPQDPDFYARSLAALQNQPWAAVLGMEAGDIAPGRFEIRLAVREMHLQHDGIVHGGVLATLADTAVALAAYTLAAPGERIVTVEFKINYLRPATGPILVCRGTVLRPGRTITVSEAEIYMDSGEGTPKLAAKALATIAVLPAVPDSTGGVRV